MSLGVGPDPWPDSLQPRVWQNGDLEGQNTQSALLGVEPHRRLLCGRSLQAGQLNSDPGERQTQLLLALSTYPAPRGASSGGSKCPQISRIESWQL